MLGQGQILALGLLYGEKVKTVDFVQKLLLVDQSTKRVNEFKYVSITGQGQSLPKVTKISKQNFVFLFSSETIRSIETKFYIKPLWDGGRKLYLNGPCYMTKVAAMLIYVKSLSKTNRPIALKLSM